MIYVQCVIGGNICGMDTMKVNSSDPTISQIKELLTSQYGLSGDITRLPGENYNYQVTTADGQRVVLKIAGEGHPKELLELENALIEKVHAAGIEIDLPRFIFTNSGGIEASHTTSDGRFLRARLLEFVPGTPWCEAGTPSEGQLRHLGRTLASLDLALTNFEHPADRSGHRWDLASASQHRDKAVLINDPERKRILEWMFHLYAASALPRLGGLPHSWIHADANDENLLVQSARVSGLLDFGDSLYNPTVCELAVALAYALLDQLHPLQAGAHIVAGYHTVRPLSLEELEILYPLMVARLCTTVTVASERRRIDPGHPNWFVTEERAWDLLEGLYPLDPVDAGRQLASGTGLELFNDLGESIQVLLERRERHIGPSLSIAYDEPIKMVRGAGQYLYDQRGRPYLDLVNNVCHVGHCHPRVVAAGQRQMAVLNTNTRYIYDGLTEYAERLCATLPEPLDTCFFVNSGSEANELALRLAMAHTGRRDFVVVEGSYHGHTTSLINISPYKFMGKGGSGKPEPWVHIVPMPDGYRGPHKGYDHEVGKAYGDEVGRAIAGTRAPVAGFITESLLSVGGQIIPPQGYLGTAFEHMRAAGGVCIADEVQVGFGRVGTHFWAFELQEVVPDIVVMGKPMGNGHPLAGVVTSREIANSFANGMEFFSTFGGNPVSCAIGLAVLDVIRDEGLQAHALAMGERMLEGLRGLMAEHPLVGDVRGVGLFIGIELVRDRATLEPAGEEVAELVNRMKRRGVLLSTDGPYHNVIKIKPPLVLSAEDVDMFVRVLGHELTALRPD